MTVRRGIDEIVQGVRSGARKAETVLDELLADIQSRDPGLNCFTSVMSDPAHAQARRIDDEVKAGRRVGPLAGAPFAVKDLFDVQGRVTHAGSRILADAAPADRDAVVVQRLKAAGAVLVGTSNMDEFAYGYSTENAHYGPTRNPHDPSRTAGGSSGGSAAAVAAGLASFALGSDTNGSIRVPAALCGVFGMKPTFGRLPRDGATPFVASLDHVGHFAGSVRDLQTVYGCMLDTPGETVGGMPAERSPVDTDIAQPPRVGLLEGWFRTSASPEALAAVDQVAAAFPAARRVDLVDAGRARSAAFCITAAEAGHLHLANLRSRAQDFDPATRDRLIAGALLPASVYLQAQRFRREFQAEVARVFEEVDVLIAPCTPCSAPQIGQATIEIDGRSFAVRPNLGIYTQPISFVGLPVIALPVHASGCMPLGVQLIGRPWSEALLFAVAHGLEAAGVVSAKLLEASAS
jgi:AtzE family amidohydrolase